MPDPITVDLSTFDRYATARRTFLAEIDASVSCRDPLSEFSEWLTAKQLGGTMAASRVQKRFDLIRQTGRRVQVNYLSIPSDRWINEHHIKFPAEADEYALVVFEAMKVNALIVFSKDTLATACERLGKRHGNSRDAAVHSLNL